MSVPAEARRAVDALFAAELARRYPGTVWSIEDLTDAQIAQLRAAAAPVTEAVPDEAAGPGEAA